MFKNAAAVLQEQVLLHMTWVRLTSARLAVLVKACLQQRTQTVSPDRSSLLE